VIVRKGKGRRKGVGVVGKKERKAGAKRRANTPKPSVNKRSWPAKGRKCRKGPKTSNENQKGTAQKDRRNRGRKKKRGDRKSIRSLKK